MNLLLDTHTFIWLAENGLRLSHDAKTAIENRSNTIYISLSSFWEVGIKSVKGN